MRFLGLITLNYVFEVFGKELFNLVAIILRFFMLQLKSIRRLQFKINAKS